MFPRYVWLAVAAALVLTVAGCGSKSSNTSGKKTISYSRVVDLTHVIDPKIPLWPGDPHVVFKVVATFPKDGYYLRSFTIGEHSATHMNAPNSFISGDKNSITSYPVEQRVVPAVVIDIRGKAKANADYQLTKHDVLAWEKQHERIAPGSFDIGGQDGPGEEELFITR